MNAGGAGNGKNFMYTVSWNGSVWPNSLHVFCHIVHVGFLDQKSQRFELVMAEKLDFIAKVTNYSHTLEEIKGALKRGKLYKGRVQYN